MHLKQLKLAGFKSFVDPTVVDFPSQLVAVVGPNGCGKSNIIDAVRWVMGESSAKNLRGESMVDVIFNGSSHRKSVGQASVELIFDNSLGRLIGPFASYGEIAVKRVVTRDGDSAYYLNGSRCRRRDITDIFLGTGAGARSYSIIGQGTISRLIEAKPEELRIFLEEAAGVSKYKERRRETLQRMEHTQDNLTRVADIREELDKQLQRLERQAKAAERYTALKEQEALCRVEIIALKWQALHQQQEMKRQCLQEITLQQEQVNSALTELTAKKIECNERLHDSDEKTQQIQAKVYQLGTEMARIEETLQQHHREQKRLEHDKQQLQADWQKAEQQIKQDAEDVILQQEYLVNLQARLVQLKEGWSDSRQQLEQTQENYAIWESRWQEAHHIKNTTNNEMQLAQLKLEHATQQRQQYINTLDELNKELLSISLDELQTQQQQLNEQEQQLSTQQQALESQLVMGHEQYAQKRMVLEEIEQRLYQLQNDFQRQNSEYAALVAVQKAVRFNATQEQNIVAGWENNPRLLEILAVDPLWQHAYECVLQEDLHAYVLPNPSLFTGGQWEQCLQARENVVSLSQVATKQNLRPKLVDKLTSAVPLTSKKLESIYAASSWDDVLEWLPNLSQDESIVTMDGVWVGQGWIKFHASAAVEDEMGLLARQQRIVDLAAAISVMQQQIEGVREERETVYQQMQSLNQGNEQMQIEVNAGLTALKNLHLTLSRNQQQLLLAEQRLNSILHQREELLSILEEVNEQQVLLSAQLTEIKERYQQLEFDYTQLESEKQQQQSQLKWYTEQVTQAQQLVHQSELDAERAQTKLQQLTEHIVRERERLLLIEERLEHLVILCEHAIKPGAELKDQLANYLSQYQESESILLLSREQSAHLKGELDQCNQLFLQQEQWLKKIENQASEVRMQEQALIVKAEGLLESLEELGVNGPQEILARIPQEVTQGTREEELLALTEKIKRLGAINLAAIEEYATEQQRKTYLDEQYDDLNQALNTLQTAIHKMDQETRLRLDNTFNEVNTSFKSLFPRLFGGGQAQLELTCDNLLEAGIVVMAQPPGKRNSTIHLLSGGEKAMTAVALVFAIFQLNPSPFCMLDEVDAPLDDVNVGRFCEVVKEMSPFVQFLFITHNKVAMELAEHLIGVTMREPGVSRLVAVDVKDALGME